MPPRSTSPLSSRAPAALAVAAFLAIGGLLAQLAPHPASPAAAAAPLAFAPVADARVQEANATTNYGTATTLRVDGGRDPDVETYLRFAVTGLTGPVQTAKLRLWATSATADGPVLYAAATGWIETGITWKTRPARAGGAVDDRGAIAAKAWAEYDVTALVRGDGAYAFALASLSTDGVDFQSREAANKPQLVVTVGVAPAAVAADTPTSTPTATPIPPAPPTAPPAPTGTGTVPPPGASAPVLLAAGDVATCNGDGDERTAALLDDLSGTVALLGDGAYPNGSADDYATCYAPTWGRHKARTRPAPGNHEYQTPGAAGYYAYFGAAAGDPAEGWYAYDLGGWHVVVLNSNLDMAAGSAQETWLRADLASHPATCTLAYLHHPRFSSGSTHGDKRGTEPLWRALYEAGAELVLAGHEHSYERFAPQDPTGVADPAFGLRSFVVGVGGAGFYPLGPPAANSEARQNDTFGVLALTLRPDGYDWRFVSEAGKIFTDTGTGSCHAAPPTPTGTDGAVSSTAIATAAPIGSAPSDAPVMAGAPAFGPVADARVEEANPTTNYGSGTTLRADAGAGVAIESYLRFAVSETAGPVRRATLRLWATDATADGPAVHGCGDTAWAEKAITWASRPGRAGAATADAEAIAAGGWVAYDVTSLVSGNGAVCLALVPQSTDGVTFSSRQATTATNRPQLVVEVAAPSPTGVPGGPATTATPTTTPLSEDTAAPTSTDTQVSSTPTAASTVPTDTPTDTPVPPTATPTDTAVPPTLTPTSTSTPTDTAVPTTPS